MQLTLLTVLAATAAALPAAEQDFARRAGTGTVPSTIPTTFPVVEPLAALSALSAKAEATPAAVQLVAGVPLKITSNGPEDAPPKSGPLLTDKQTAWIPPPPGAHSSTLAKRAGCGTLGVVREWSSPQVTDQQRRDFTNANKCLMNTPARSGLPGVKTRWDDLAAIHANLTPTIHEVGQFLPWHRYFLWIYEQEMRRTCKYSGPMLWWDETKYAGRFHTAPHFSPAYYGTLPLDNYKCVTDGAFNGLWSHIGPGPQISNNCFARMGNEAMSAHVTAAYVSTCNSYSDFNTMQDCSSAGPHAMGHVAVGGVMGDVFASPQAPEFFLHHHFINRNWRVWQGVDPSKRTYAIGGVTDPSCQGASCQRTTFHYVLQSLGFYPNVTLDYVLNTQGGFLCYIYDY